MVDVATVCARSTFERPLSCVGDSDAGDRDLLPAYSHCLAVRRGKAVFDQVSYHIDVEPMGEQSCPRAAAQPCIGKHFERPPLLPAEVNPRQPNAPQRQNFLADRICHLRTYANRDARPRPGISSSSLAPCRLLASSFSAQRCSPLRLRPNVTSRGTPTGVAAHHFRYAGSRLILIFPRPKAPRARCQMPRWAVSG